MGIEGGFTYFRCTTRAKEAGIYRVHEEGFFLFSWSKFFYLDNLEKKNCV